MTPARATTVVTINDVTTRPEGSVPIVFITLTDHPTSGELVQAFKKLGLGETAVVRTLDDLMLPKGVLTVALFDYPDGKFRYRYSPGHVPQKDSWTGNMTCRVALGGRWAPTHNYDRRTDNFDSAASQIHDHLQKHLSKEGLAIPLGPPRKSPARKRSRHPEMEPYFCGYPSM